MIVKLAHSSRASPLAEGRHQFRLHHRLNYGRDGQRNPARPNQHDRDRKHAAHAAAWSLVTVTDSG